MSSFMKKAIPQITIVYSVFCLSAIVSKFFTRKCGLCQSNKVTSNKVAMENSKL